MERFLAPTPANIEPTLEGIRRQKFWMFPLRRTSHDCVTWVLLFPCSAPFCRSLFAKKKKRKWVVHSISQDRKAATPSLCFNCLSIGTKNCNGSAGLRPEGRNFMIFFGHDCFMFTAGPASEASSSLASSCNSPQSLQIRAGLVLLSNERAAICSHPVNK